MKASLALAASYCVRHAVSAGKARARRAHSLVLLRLRLARFLELRDLHFLRLTRLSRLDEREAHL